MSVTLKLCPFCGGTAEFVRKPKNVEELLIVHWPAKGVVCPARYEQYCESEEQGAAWWNQRYEEA